MLSNARVTIGQRPSVQPALGAVAREFPAGLAVHSLPSQLAHPRGGYGIGSVARNEITGKGKAWATVAWLRVDVRGVPPRGRPV